MKPIVKNYLAGFDPNKHVIVARSNCKKCHARGIVGKNLTTGKAQVCTCLRLTELKDISQINKDLTSVALAEPVEPIHSISESIAESGEVTEVV